MQTNYGCCTMCATYIAYAHWVAGVEHEKFSCQVEQVARREHALQLNRREWNYFFFCVFGCSCGSCYCCFKHSFRFQFVCRFRISIFFCSKAQNSQNIRPTMTKSMNRVFFLPTSEEIFRNSKNLTNCAAQKNIHCELNVQQ